MNLRGGSPGRGPDLALRALTALALLIDAGVHIHLAPGYQAGSPQGVGQGTLFLVESAAAALAALAVLLRGSTASYVFAFLVALSAFGAVMFYRYVNLPAFGPFPAMYEPVWYFEKTVSAIAEGAGAALAGLGVVRTRRARQRLPGGPGTGRLRA